MQLHNTKIKETHTCKLNMSGKIAMYSGGLKDVYSTTLPEPSTTLALLCLLESSGLLSHTHKLVGLGWTGGAMMVGACQNQVKEHHTR